MEERLKKLFEEAEKVALKRSGERFSWAGSVRVEAIKACALLAIAIKLQKRR